MVYLFCWNKPTPSVQEDIMLTFTEASAALDTLIEERISLALTQDVLSKLAAKGYSEDAARVYLRAKFL
jgi:hypothetical protein